MMRTVRKTGWMAAIVLVVSGCGNAPLVGSDPDTEKPDAQIAEPEQGPAGPPGPPGEDGPSDLLSWGLFVGNPPVDVSVSGGPIDVLSFTRISTGMYEIEYDVPRDEIGLVAPIGSTLGGVFSGSDALGASILSFGIESEATNLTIQVFTVRSELDPDNPTILLATDSNFSFTIFGLSSQLP